MPKNEWVSDRETARSNKEKKRNAHGTLVQSSQPDTTFQSHLPRVIEKRERRKRYRQREVESGEQMKFVPEEWAHSNYSFSLTLSYSLLLSLSSQRPLCLSSLYFHPLWFRSPRIRPSLSLCATPSTAKRQQERFANLSQCSEEREIEINSEHKLTQTFATHPLILEYSVR